MSKVSPFFIVTPESTLESILGAGTCAGVVLTKLGFPDCKTCSVRFDETLAEAALNYGLNLETVLMALNANLLKERVRTTMKNTGSEIKTHNGGTR